MLIMETCLDISNFLQDLGPLIKLDNIEEIIDKIKKRDNFNGIPFKVNYAEKSIPYCYLNKQGKIEGIFKDAIEIIAEHLNLSLVYHESSPENRNIWSVK